MSKKQKENFNSRNAIDDHVNKQKLYLYIIDVPKLEKHAINFTVDYTK